MKKQKAAAPNDPNIKAPKVPRSAIPSHSQTEPLSLHLLSRPISHTQSIDPSPALKDDFEQLTEIWESGRKNALSIPQDQVQSQFQVQFTVIKDRLAQHIQEIEQLYKKLSNDKRENEKMTENIEECRKKRDEISRGQKLIDDLHKQMQEHTYVLINTQKDCEQSRLYVAQVYTNTSLKQEEIIKKLTEQLNDQISEKKNKLEVKLQLKRGELANLETIELAKIEKEINEQTQLKNEIDSEIKEAKSILENNGKRYDQEIREMLEIMEVKEADLNLKKEERCKLEAQAKEGSKKHDELYSEYNRLQIQDSEDESQNKALTSSLLNLREEETSLNEELDELKKNHLMLLSNKDLELDDTRKQLQDLTLLSRKATDALREAISNNLELSKAADKLIAEKEQLEKSLKDKDDEIMNIGINLSNLTDQNNGMNEEIQTQKRELITLGKCVSDNKAIFKTRHTEQNEATKKEDEIIAELATIDQQLSNESKELATLLEEERNEKIRSTEQAKQFKREMKEIEELIRKDKETIAGFEREIGRKESQYQKKIKDATHSSKQCKLASHEKQIKEQNNKIDSLTGELAGEKLKRKQTNAKKNAVEAKKKELRENQMKTMESRYEDLNKVLSGLKAEYSTLLSESKEAKKPTKEPTSGNSTPRPILKSAMKDSPQKLQKVQFDLGPSSMNMKPINAMEIFEESERRFAALPIGGPKRPDWSKIGVLKSSEKIDTVASIVTFQEPQEPPASKPRKFFKNSRLGLKKNH